MTETELQNAVVEMAGLLGWMSYHTYDSRRSDAGFPDLVLLRPPRLLFVELKAAKGIRTGRQQHWGDQLERVAVAAALGGAPLVNYELWRPADWLNGAVERALR